MKKEDVVAGMLAYIAHLREVGRYSTAKSYLDALRSFKCFCGMEEILLKSLFILLSFI